MHTYNTMLRIVALVILAHCATGQASRLVLKGHNANLGQFPHTVFIRTYITYCSGTIISKKWVLTAAHCLIKNAKPEEYNIYAGIVDYYARTYPESAQIRTGKTMITHPDYELFDATNGTDIGSFNDLGLLEVNQTFEFNKYVNKAILPYKKPFGLKSCQAIGYGDSEHGKDHVMRYINIEEIVRCKTVKDTEFNELYTNDLYLCSYPDNNESAVLGGDSGGPLICPGNLVVGICFWGKPQENAPFIILDVSTQAFLEWIRSNAKLGEKRKITKVFVQS